jgi:hypothetical protein
MQALGARCLAKVHPPGSTRGFARTSSSIHKLFMFAVGKGAYPLIARHMKALSPTD